MFSLPITALFALNSKCLLFGREVEHMVENVFTFLCGLYSFFLGHISMFG